MKAQHRRLLLSLAAPVLCGLVHVIAAPAGVPAVLAAAALLLGASQTLFRPPSSHGPRAGPIAAAVSLSVAVFYVLAVLFGAHPTRHRWEVLSWALLMTTLCTLPAALLLTRGPLYSWVRVFLHSRFSSGEEQCVFVSFLSTLLGAWLGAFPILLDWNRDWQVFPIPCSIGAVLGHTAGGLGCAVLTACTEVT